MNNPVLSLKGVSKIYGRGSAHEITVLNNVDLQLHAGEAVALIAPSGAGKSTLLHIAGLLDVPDTGQITLDDGTDMTTQSDFLRTQIRRTHIGFVYQFHHLLPEFSALENIALPQLAAGRTAAQAHTQAHTLLARVGLEHRARHRPSDLSGGEQQRVAFCRALANTPKILLADEPTGNLDPATSDTVFMTLINLVRETGLAALIATHNHDLARRMDRIITFKDGVLRTHT